MPRYEFRCPEGHVTVHIAPIGAAPAQAPCHQCDQDAQRIFSVPTLILSYPVSFSDAMEQVTKADEDARRNYKRPEHGMIMERAREQIADRERGRQRWKGGEV